MALIELEYEERADGLLYPILDMGEKRLAQLDKFGKQRPPYLHSEKFELYREMLLTGKLAEHPENIEKQADELHERLFQSYLSQHTILENDFLERVAVFEQASKWADEIVFSELIYN